MISHELAIQSYQQGITLARPDVTGTSSHEATSVAQILTLPMNIYFMNPDSVMQEMNDACASSCGFMSVQDAIGSSIGRVSSRDTALPIFANDRAIIDTKKTQVITESFTRIDDMPLTAVSLKFPWYQNEKVVGILGCSILQGLEGTPSLPEALTMLIHAGLLAPPVKTSVTSRFRGSEFCFGLLNEREIDILYLVVRGKTAKNIAKQFQLSHRTIEHLMDAIKHKLKVSSKAELIDKVFDQMLDIPA